MAFAHFFQRPKSALIRISILRFLYEEPMHGYELMKRIETHTDGRWIPSHSLLYNTLSKLEENGFLTSQKDYKGEIERTIYSITNKGKDHLDEELTQLARTITKMMSSISIPQFPNLPRFLLDHLPPNERKQFLLQMQARFEEALKEIKNEVKKLD